MKTILLFN